MDPCATCRAAVRQALPNAVAWPLPVTQAHVQHNA